LEESQALKIAVTGKGGTGKSTVAGILAWYFRNSGCKVLAVDADPDANLASAIGIPQDLTASLVPISERRDLIRQRTGAEPGEFGQMFKMNPAVSDIPDEYAVDFKGIRLLVMGAIRKGGGGCACAENVLLQSLLREIVLNRDEVVIVDMEAGIEHLGRATCKAVDRMLITVEPGARSIATAKRIMDLAGEIGIRAFGVVANKLAGEAQGEWIARQFAPGEIIGMIPFSQKILDADLSQIPLIDNLDDDLRTAFDNIYRVCRKGG
jgi:CO dehydrogenase maturation factor